MCRAGRRCAAAQSRTGARLSSRCCGWSFSTAAHSSGRIHTCGSCRTRADILSSPSTPPAPPMSWPTTFRASMCGKCPGVQGFSRSGNALPGARPKRWCRSAWMRCPPSSSEKICARWSVSGRGMRPVSASARPPTGPEISSRRPGITYTREQSPYTASRPAT